MTTHPTAARLGVTYPPSLPASAAEIPAGQILAHNHVRGPVRRQGWRGFRFWYQAPSDRTEPCPCDWAPEVGTHYRINPTYTCPVCNGPVPPRKRPGGNLKTYCSPLCKSRAGYRRRADTPISGPPRQSWRKRRPLPDFAHDAGWTLRKAVERIERIMADDRLTANREQVTTELDGHLKYAADACAHMLSQLHQHEEG